MTSDIKSLIGRMNAYGCMDRSSHDEHHELLKDLLLEGATALEKLTAEKPAEVPVNLNNRVRVKLTPYGLECHRKEFERVFAGYNIDYRPPRLDAEGYLDTQLWCLMQEYGPYITIGGQLPFETVMLIKPNKEAA